MKKLLRTVCIAFIALIAPVTANASCNILIDGKELICYDFDKNVIEPFVEGGTTYVPLRAVAQAFDISVLWDMETKTVFLGDKEGSPVLSENINIYYKGEEFIARDANGARVYPILRNSSTYLPIRSIGELFGKNVAWDNATQSVILTTPPSNDEYSYLINAVTNTEKTSDLMQDLSFTGTMYYNSQMVWAISDNDTIAYSPYVFSFSSMVNEKELNTVSYLGEGKYFIYAPSTKFAASPYVIQALINSLGETRFSPLYITVCTKGGYITDISANVYAQLTYNDLTFDESFNIKSSIIYPADFTLPHIPYPESVKGEDEEFVFSQDTADAAAISDLVTKYTSFSLSSSAADLSKMLCKDDYAKLFSNKSKNQQDLQLNTISKKLSGIYKYATDEYKVSSMVYVTNPESYKNSPEKAARILLEFNCSDGKETWIEETELILVKINGAWYLDSSVIEALM